MKVAICITGLPKGNYQETYKRFQQIFPDIDIFAATWDYEKSNKNLPTDTYFFPQPNMHYHSLMDIPDDIMPPVLKTWDLRKKCKTDRKIREKIGNGTYQILCHSLLLQSIPNDYDMIIRSRWDTHLSPHVDFDTLITNSYNNKKAIGLGVRTTRYTKLHKLYAIPKIWNRMPGSDLSISHDWGGYIMDPLILHPREIFNHDLCWNLHNQKHLMSSERGWYQILSKPFSDNHDCYYGGAQLERFMKKTDH